MQPSVSAADPFAAQRVRDNLTLWKPGGGGHVESYFLKLNDPAQRVAVWLKFTIYAPKDARKETVGEVWGIVFDAADPARSAAWKQTYPIQTCRLARTDFELEFGPSWLRAGATEGQLTGPSGLMSWKLRFTPGEAPVAHFPLAWMYTAEIPKSKIKTPYPSSRFSGSVVMNGRTYTFEAVPGMQGHNWGSEHSYHYAWSHCSAFEGEGDDTFFEGFSSRVKIGPWVTPFLSMAVLSWRGHRWIWNGWKALRSPNIRVENNRWHFEIRGGTHVLRGEVAALTERFMGLHYYNPDGQVLYCLNSKIADAKIQLIEGDSVLAELRSSGTTALEVLVRDPNHGVRMGV